jgi:hypothetical protein
MQEAILHCKMILLMAEELRNRENQGVEAECVGFGKPESAGVGKGSLMRSDARAAQL